jgi:hypothetical protein
MNSRPYCFNAGFSGAPNGRPSHALKGTSDFVHKPANSKFSMVALCGANVALEALAQDLRLDDGLLILAHPPVAVDAAWEKWLGTIKGGAFKDSNLVIVASAPSACPFIVDDENQSLERRCLNLLIALGLNGVWFEGPGMILNGCHLDEQSPEPTQVRQVHDSAWYRRLNDTIPRSLNREDLVAAATLASPINDLLQRERNRLLKGLSAPTRDWKDGTATSDSTSSSGHSKQ